MGLHSLLPYTDLVTLPVTPIFWQPSGGRYVFPARFQSIIDGYIANVAAASGATSNVFSIDDEYYDKVKGAEQHVSYRMTAGTPIIDTGAFPSNGCTPASGYTACITDDQLRTELRRVLSSHSLPSDLAHFYPMFFPPGVETKDRDGTTSAGTSAGTTGRSDRARTRPCMRTCRTTPRAAAIRARRRMGSSPHDGLIDSFSHELNEAITDPLDTAWFDTKGNEQGDMCTVYGAPLGSTNSSDPKGTEYNQVINGGKYYTQAEFSNLAFDKLGDGKGCGCSEAQVRVSPAGHRARARPVTGGNGGASASLAIQGPVVWIGRDHGGQRRHPHDAAARTASRPPRFRWA